ncbi:MAG TPA: pyridoxamine 5'-phosphate oxidase family protein [Acidimicrobiales bacterium]|nr:pyridoxamine 5'-phosphate oxidase family protein [Acidimicrobiales bacterium]
MALMPLAVTETVPGLGEIPRLSPQRCRALLAGAVAGHLALSQGALPLVVPVTCAVRGGYLLVRAGRGWLGRATLDPGIVAFQTASTSFSQDWRWEVAVQGRAEVVSGLDAEVPPRLCLIDNQETSVLRVSMEIVTGWQYGGPSEPKGPFVVATAEAVAHPSAQVPAHS